MNKTIEDIIAKYFGIPKILFKNDIKFPLSRIEKSTIRIARFILVYILIEYKITTILDIARYINISDYHVIMSMHDYINKNKSIPFINNILKELEIILRKEKMII